MSFEDHQGRISLDDEVNALGDERTMICFERAARKHGLEVGEFPDEDDEDFMILFAHELKVMVVTDITTNLMREGLIEPARVDDEGEILWTITEDGKEELTDE